jgi:tetratricopeptide (TPR) repeat protein
MSGGLALSLERNGDIDKSRKVYLKILEVDANHLWTNRRMAGIVLFHDHDNTEAKKILNKILKIDTENKFARALLFAIEGEKEDALSLDKNLYVYSLLDMKKEALREVDSTSMVTEFSGWCSYISLKNWKVLDFIREEPAFKEVLEEAKIVHEERIRKYGHLFDD